MQSTSSTTIDRDFTTEQVVSNNSEIHIIIDTGSKPAYEVNVSEN